MDVPPQRREDDWEKSGGAGSRKRPTTPVLRGLAHTPARLPQLSLGLVGSGLGRLDLFGQPAGKTLRNSNVAHGHARISGCRGSPG